MGIFVLIPYYSLIVHAYLNFILAGNQKGRDRVKMHVRSVIVDT